MSDSKSVEVALVEYIAKALVENPDEVSINAVEGEKSTILELRVAPSDMGKLIGKQGRIARAMRTLLQSAATRNGRWFVLEILD